MFIIIWDGLILAKFSFYQKWNEARLLITNMVYTQCLTSYQTALGLGSYEIRK